MGRKRKPVKRKDFSDFLEIVYSHVERKRKDITTLKDDLFFRIDQLCAYTRGELSDVLCMKLSDFDNIESSVVEENITVSADERDDVPLKFLLPNTVKSARKTNKNVHTTAAVGLEYTTPANKPVPKYCITPKVNPFSPVSMLRLPQQGEFAVSAAGSPLQVTCLGNNTASVSIPLRNGKVMSVLPKEGINTEVIHANLEPSVKQQLETLRSAISKILET